MKKNFYVAPEFEKYAEEFFDIFYRDASTKLSNYMKETVELVSDKYKHAAEFGHETPDASTYSKAVFYGKFLANEVWELEQGQAILCFIYLLLDGSYLLNWIYTPASKNETIYHDYKIIKGALDKPELSFEQERPRAWKYPGYKNVPKTIAIPKSLLEKAAKEEEVIRQDPTWPGLPLGK